MLRQMAASPELWLWQPHWSCLQQKNMKFSTWYQYVVHWMWNEDDNPWGVLKGNAGRDQAGSTCFGICTMGSRQKIDYGAETLIRCLSPLSLPQTEHPLRTTILHPLTSFPDRLINKISSPPHKALCTPSLLHQCARMMSIFFPGQATRFLTSQCFPFVHLPMSFLPSLTCNLLAVLDTSPAYIYQCTCLLGRMLLVGKQDWF